MHDRAFTVREQGGRERAVDIARSLVVIGVVFNHVVDGLKGAAVILAGSGIAQFNDALYIFRMPALVFLVGLFVQRSVSRHGSVVYLTNRAVLMLYLYLLWFAIEGVVETFAGGLRNGTRPLYELAFVWRPIAHLWFLPFLVLSTVLIVWLRPWSRDVRGVGGFLLLACITIGAWGWNPPVAGLSGISLVAFMGAGAVVGLDRLRSVMGRPWWQWLIVGCIAACAFLLLNGCHPVPATQEKPTGLLVHVVSSVAASFGIVVLLAIAVILSRLPTRKGLLEVIGRHTLPIYLAHVIVVAGLRIVLVDFLGVREVVVVLLVCLSAGVGLPLLAALALRRLHVAWVFGLPVPISARLP